MTWKPRLRKDRPLFAALAAAIADDIQAGRLKAGERLPPQRELADWLGVTVTTVTRGYAEAERQGLVRGEVGRGTFVRPPVFEPRDAGAAPGPVDLTVNAILPHAHAGEVLERLAALTRQPGAERLLDYQPHGGRREQRAHAAEFLRAGGVPCEGADVVFTAGAQHAMAVALGALTGPGETVLTENVTYSGVRSLANHLHLQLAAVDMDAEGLEPSSLERVARQTGARVLYCTPSHQNPTGRVMSRARRERIAEIAARLDLQIVEDEAYAFLAEEATPIASLVPDRTFHLVSLSKSLAPGLRIGLLRAPRAWIHRLDGAIFATVVTSTPLMTAVTASLMADGTAARIIEWKRREVRARQQLARRVLADLTIRSAEASPHVWLELPGEWSADDFARDARLRGLLVSPARAFTVPPTPAPAAVRVCLGSLPERASLEAALSGLAEIAASTPHPFGSTV